MGMSDNVNQRNSDLLRITALEVACEEFLALVRDLMIDAEKTPQIDSGDILCAWCRYLRYDHAPDCAWLRAKTLIDKAGQ